MPMSFGRAVGEEKFFALGNRLALEYCKWDAQVGDTATLFRQPLLLQAEVWRELSAMAETLAAELMEAEQELLERPELHALLGLDRKLRPILEHARRHGATPSAVRTLRFDFHHTTEGWRISEVNSDVPGGYTEASCFTALMAAEFPVAEPAGNPGKQWTDLMQAAAGDGGCVALLSAPGFLEDQQVTVFLATQLQERGLRTFLVHDPAQLRWQSGKASVTAGVKQVGVDAIVRFYQGEWLLKLPSKSEWNWLFAGGKTPVANSGISLLTESKRFSLVWRHLKSQLTTWQALLPECRSPSDGGWESGDSWILKQAFSNTGDAVHARAWIGQKEWSRLCRAAKRNPELWVVQRKFETRGIPSDAGEVYPCIGIYTMNGRTAGAYARASRKHIIDYAAMDVALLIKKNSDAE